MDTLTDQDLIEALRKRLDNHSRALSDLRAVTTKLEATNGKLQESESLKSHFLSNIRNEINNPLAAIIGLASRLTGECGKGETLLIGRLIFAEASALEFQLENVFAAAELEAGEAAPSPALSDVVAIVTEAIAEMKHLAEEKGVSLRGPSGSETLPFVTDPRMLRLMTRNLLANAVEFSPTGGIVDIDLIAEEEEVRIAVQDRGDGIDPADHAAIFDRFRQLDSGSCKRHRGHGLGLSVTRATAELLGGRVDLHSAPGRGSTFTLVLPRIAANVQALATDGNFVLFDHVERF